MLISVWRRFQRWRFNRDVSNFVYMSAETMLTMAADRLGRELTKQERDDLPAIYGKWLVEEGETRLNMLLDRPVRTLHLFCSHMWP